MLLRYALLCCIVFMSGCSFTSSIIETMPESNLLVELSDAELFAVRPDGEMVAYVDEGVNIMRLTDKYLQRLTYDQPSALIWAPDGNSLVAAFREAEKTRLVRLTPSESDRQQVFVDEMIGDMAWLSDGRLLALASRVDVSDDLLQLNVSLLIWDGQWDVERIPLYNNEFYHRPSNLDVDLVQRFDLSPLKDELIYNRYIDPPVLGGRVELVKYNLLTEREIVLAQNDNRQAEAFLAGDSEMVLLPDGKGQVLLTNPWNYQVKYRWDALGESIQAAPFRELFYIDGKLYSKDNLQLSLPFGSRAQFSADGSRLFVAWQRKLYLFSGYDTPEPVQFTAVEKVKLQRIRQLRSRGEISIREYYQFKNNILNP